MKPNLESMALEAVFLTHKSRRVIPLDKIKGDYKIVDKPTFQIENETPGVCMSRKFNSIEDIEKELSDPNKIYHVLEVCEFDVYGMNLEKTGKTTYTLRACIRERKQDVR